MKWDLFVIPQDGTENAFSPRDLKEARGSWSQVGSKPFCLKLG